MMDVYVYISAALQFNFNLNLGHLTISIPAACIIKIITYHDI